MATFTKNEDGSITVRIPKAPEVYDPADGGLYIEETISSKAFGQAIKPFVRKAPAETPETPA